MLEKLKEFEDIVYIERVEVCDAKYKRYEIRLKNVDKNLKNHVVGIIYDDGFIDYYLANAKCEITDIPMDEYRQLAKIMKKINKR